MKHTECAIQRGILKHLADKGIWAVHVPNGSKLAGTDTQRNRAGARLKADGMCPGFPDLILYASEGRVGHIEVKREGGYQQDTQKACQARLEGMGQHYAVCRSTADVDETLERWGWL